LATQVVIYELRGDEYYLFLTCQLYASGSDPRPYNIDIKGSDLSVPTPTTATENKPEVELRCFEYDDDDDDEKTDDEYLSVSRIDSGFEDIPDGNLHAANDIDSTSGNYDEVLLDEVIVSDKQPSPRPGVLIPQPAIGVETASGQRRGGGGGLGGGSACESVSPTRARVPLHQLSRPRLLPTDEVTSPDPLPGCCHPTSSFPVLPTSSAVDSITGSRSRVDGSVASPLSSVTDRPSKRRLDDSAETAASDAKRRFTADDDGDDEGCRRSRDAGTDEVFITFNFICFNRRV